MLNKLRIGQKLLLAPGLVLVLLTMLSGAAYYGMVRQNASLEHMVQVRAARLQAVADVAGEARFAHANAYQLLAWTNGSFAENRLRALTAAGTPPSATNWASSRMPQSAMNARRSRPRRRR